MVVPVLLILSGKGREKRPLLVLAVVLTDLPVPDLKGHVAALLLP